MGYGSNKALLPKKHAEFRLNGEVQVPESEFIAPVKGKARYVPVVILVGSTVPINDAIMGIAADLAEEGIEVQLTCFPAWLFLTKLICLVLTPRKASIPCVQRMVVQCLETALEDLENVGDPFIALLDRANARAGVHLKISSGYPPHTYTPWEKGKKTKFDSKNKMVVRMECDSKNKSILMNAAVRNAWNKELRKYVAIRSFLLVLLDEETAIIRQ